MTFWKMMLVNSGVEHILVKRQGRSYYNGTVWAGFSMQLTLGDSVLVKVDGRRWLKKYDICLHRGRPALHFGKCYGRPNSYVYLNSLPHVPGQTYQGHQRRSHADRGRTTEP